MEDAIEARDCQGGRVVSLETKQKKFEEEFEERTQEILILTDNSGIGAAGMGDGVWKPS